MCLPRSLQKRKNTLKIDTRYFYGKLSACPFAKFLGAELGRGTISQIEAVLGKGRQMIGVHSNSGRVWSFRKGTEIYVDGSRSHERTYIVDFVQLMGVEGSIAEGFPKHARRRLSEIGRWRWGMKLAVLERQLRELGCKPHKFGDEIECQFKAGDRLTITVSLSNSLRGLERIRLSVSYSE
jgi:hypothetical protein